MDGKISIFVAEDREHTFCVVVHGCGDHFVGPSRLTLEEAFHDAAQARAIVMHNLGDSFLREEIHVPS